MSNCKESSVSWQRRSDAQMCFIDQPRNDKGLLCTKHHRVRVRTSTKHCLVHTPRQQTKAVAQQHGRLPSMPLTRDSPPHADREAVSGRTISLLMFASAEGRPFWDQRLIPVGVPYADIGCSILPWNILLVDAIVKKRHFGHFLSPTMDCKRMFYRKSRVV